MTLIAVSKTFSDQAIKEAYEAGIRDFGESRWQELQPKALLLPDDIRWHFVGAMQSNKAKHIAAHVHSIHSIENDRQIREIAKQNHQVEGFIQVNIADEQQKSGISPQRVDSIVTSVLKCEVIRFRGLMTIGPAVTDPEESRVWFRSLAQIGRAYSVRGLSMGMSHDFDVAIEEGATHIRVGSALFGSR